MVFSKNGDKLHGDSENADITSDEFKKFSDGFWEIQPERQRKGHPAPFPEELIYRLIKFYSYRGNVVLDMFGGTGTVAAVSSENGRKFIHVDLSKEYCRTARDRLKKKRIRTVQTFIRNK